MSLFVSNEIFSSNQEVKMTTSEITTSELHLLVQELGEKVETLMLNETKRSQAQSEDDDDEEFGLFPIGTKEKLDTIEKRLRTERQFGKKLESFDLNYFYLDIFFRA